MVRLADYEYYISDFGGSMLSRADFNRLSARASALASAYTFARAESSGLDCVKDAVCAVCEVIYKDEQRGGVKSENNDGYSVTYDEGENVEDRIYKTLLVYLQSSGLMQRVKSE